MKFQEINCRVIQPQINQIINIIDKNNNARYPFIISNNSPPETIFLFNDFITEIAICPCPDPNIIFDINNWPEFIQDIYRLELIDDETQFKWNILSYKSDYEQYYDLEVEFTENFFNLDQINQIPILKETFERSDKMIRIVKRNDNDQWILVDSCSAISIKESIEIFDTATQGKFNHQIQKYTLERPLIPKRIFDSFTKIVDNNLQYDDKITSLSTSFYELNNNYCSQDLILPDNNCTFDPNFRIFILNKEQAQKSQNGEIYNFIHDEIVINKNYCQIFIDDEKRFCNLLSLYSKTNTDGFEEFLFNKPDLGYLYYITNKDKPYGEGSTWAITMEKQGNCHILARKNEKEILTGSITKKIKVLEFITSNGITKLLNNLYIVFLEIDNKDGQNIYRFSDKFLMTDMSN